nr:P-loop NTPase fold protein [Mycolicibacterium neoaurum]
MDNAIREPHQDRLGRKRFARRLAQRIASGGRHSSMVYSLAGPWGSGKTSVLNMVSHFLEQDSGGDWAVVDFVPWAANDVSAITDEFFQAIAAAMPRNTKKGRKAAGQLLAMAPVAAAAAKAAAKSAIESKLGEGAVKNVADAIAESLADRAGDVTFEMDPFQERFEKLSATIQKAGVNVLVVVDDIDRLQPDELLSVLKAVRLLGRFDRVHYLLSFDAETVLDVLAQSDLAKGMRTRANQYMEKIVQYPFVLPPLQDSYFVGEFALALEAVAELHGLSRSYPGTGQNDPLVRLADLVAGAEDNTLTLRAVYRLASQVDMLLTLVGSEEDHGDPISAAEIDFDDAVLITHLRLRFEGLYRKLPAWSKELTGEPPAMFYLGSNNRELTRDEWVDRITTEMTAAGDTPPGANAQGVASLMTAMFPRVGATFLMEGDNRPARIHNRDYFDRYFLFDVPANDIRDARVRREILQIAKTGALPSDSLIVQHLDDFSRNGVMRRKVLANISLFSDATSINAASAAHQLMRKLTDADWDLAGWGFIIYAMLAQAITKADSQKDASGLVDKFVDDFGVWAGASVLLRPWEASPGIDRSVVLAACDNLRDQVVAICKRDLESDVWAAGDATLQTVLSFYNYLDAAALEQVRAVAQSLIATGVKPHELAGRFITIDQSGSRIQYGHGSYLKWFSTIVPDEQWDLDNIPEFDDEQVSDTDPSLENRIKLAANELRRFLEGRSVLT